MKLLAAERVRDYLLYPPRSKRLAANSLWILLARLSSQVLAFIFSLLAARFLGEAGLGQFALISALVFFANVVTTFGTDTLLIRAVAGGKISRSPFGAVLGLQLCLSTLFILGFSLSSLYLPGKTPETVNSLQVLAFSLIPQAFSSIFSAVLRGQQRMDLYLLIQVFMGLAQAAAAAFLLWKGNGLLPLAWMILSIQLLGALFAYRLCRPFLPPSLLFQRASPKQVLLLIRQSWPLALLAGLGIAYQRMGILFLSFLAGDAAAGWFSAAGRVSEGLKIFHVALLGALFPMLANLYRRETQENLRPGRSGKALLYRNVSTFLMIYSFLIVIPTVGLAKPFVLRSFGWNFAPSSGALQVLVLSLIPYTCSALVSLDLVSKGAERFVLAGLAITILAAIPLNISLILRFGLVGACWAAVGSELIQAGVLFALRSRAR
jgi:O-antigen/teichoic acid export membrane protein